MVEITSLSHLGEYSISLTSLKIHFPERAKRQRMQKSPSWGKIGQATSSLTGAVAA